MSGERPTLAEVLTDSLPPIITGYHTNPFMPIQSPDVERGAALADAARQWLLDLLADDALTKRAAVANFLGWPDHEEQGPWVDLPMIVKAGHRDAARAVLAVIAEAVRDER